MGRALRPGGCAKDRILGLVLERKALRTLSGGVPARGSVRAVELCEVGGRELGPARVSRRGAWRGVKE